MRRDIRCNIEGTVISLLLVFLLLGMIMSGCAPSALTIAQEGSEERDTAMRAVINSRDTTPAEEWLRTYPHSSWRVGVTQFVAAVKAENSVYDPYAKEDTIEGYQEFLAKYPNGYFATTAKTRIVELEKEKTQTEKKMESEKTENEKKKTKEIQTTRIMREERLAFCTAVPKRKQIITRKFLIKIKGVFDSMEDYNSRSATTGNRGILRKDIDRYTDTIAEAVGEVPDKAIAYVEETYSLLKEYFSIRTVGEENLFRLFAKKEIIFFLSKTSEWDSVCKSS
jgi:hypothetical protein